MRRVDSYRVIIDKKEGMNNTPIIYISKDMAVDQNAVVQLTNAAKIPTVSKTIATPDLHVGYGVPIGCVLGAKEIISPAAVGYDINCGMRLLKTPFEKKDINVVRLAELFRKDIPLGEGKKNLNVKKSFFYKAVQTGLKSYPELIDNDRRLQKYFNENEFKKDLMYTEDKGTLISDYKVLKDKAVLRGHEQLGTLGGGNHFIEIQEIVDLYDDNIGKILGLRKGMITVMIHSGSRGFGHEIAGYYMRMALNKCINSNNYIPSRDLAYLYANLNEGQEYLMAMKCAANFAFINRLVMANLVRKNIQDLYGEKLDLSTVYDVPHNIVKFEKHNNNDFWVHRKGATRAFDSTRMKIDPFNKIGQPVIIPGSMGTASYLLAGIKTGEESLFSVCHGAGRVLSRTQAAGKKNKMGCITDSQFKKSMEGVYLLCENRKRIKEEAPDAYKDIDKVIDVITGAKLSKMIAKMKPLAVLKG